MAGRHLQIEKSDSIIAKHGVKGVVAASVAGTVAGLSAPLAFAAPEASASTKVSATIVSATVELGTKAELLAVPDVDVVTDENAATTASVWETATVDIEAKAAPVVASTTRTTSGTVLESPTIPVGKGSAAVVAGALAQLGWVQDCTDLVQNALAAGGYTATRVQGGYDLGTGIGDYLGFGAQVSLTDLQPGDILIYGYASSGAHVAIYIGDGQAVHGGYNGSTVIAGIEIGRLPLTAAVRPA